MTCRARGASAFRRAQTLAMRMRMMGLNGIAAGLDFACYHQASQLRVLSSQAWPLLGRVFSWRQLPSPSGSRIHAFEFRAPIFFQIACCASKPVAGSDVASRGAQLNSNRQSRLFHFPAVSTSAAFCLGRSTAASNRLGLMPSLRYLPSHHA